MPTCALGLIPPYAMVGVAAPLLLVLVRLIQGFSVGGEFSGSVTYMVETAPPKRHGLAGSWANVGSMGGMLIGAGLASLITSVLSKHAAQTWGWRIPFFAGGLFGVYAYWQVRQLHEVHIARRKQVRRKSSPLKQALTRNRARTIQAILFASGYGVIFYIPLVYLPDYIHRFTDMPLDRAMQINTGATVAHPAADPPHGHHLRPLDRPAIPRRRRVHRHGHQRLLPLLSAENRGVLARPRRATRLCHSYCRAAWRRAALLVELFPKEDRLTGYSIAYNIGLGVVGGTTPAAATGLIKVTGMPTVPALYLTGWAILAAIAVLCMRPLPVNPKTSTSTTTSATTSTT